MHIPLSITHCFLLSLVAAFVFSSCSKQESGSASETSVADVSTSNQYSGHTLRIYPLPHYRDQDDIQYILDREALVQYRVNRENYYNSSPFGEDDIDLTPSNLQPIDDKEHEGFNALIDFYNASSSSISLRALSFIPAKKSYGLSATECIATDYHSVYVLATEEHHKAIYADLKPNILKLIKEHDTTRTYELAIRLGSGTEKEKELARVYSHLPYESYSLAPWEDEKGTYSGFQDIKVSCRYNKPSKLQFKFLHQGQLHSHTFNNVPDNSTQKVVLENSNPESSLTAHLAVATRTKFLKPIECPYPEALPFTPIESTNLTKKSSPRHFTRSYLVPHDTARRMEPKSTEEESKNRVSRSSKNLIILSDKACKDLNLHKGVSAIDVKSLFKKMDVELVHAYIITENSKLLAHGTVKALDEVEKITRDMGPDDPMILRMDMTLLHCPIPRFGSWITQTTLDKATVVDRITVTNLPGSESYFERTGLIEMVEIFANIGSGHEREFLFTDFKFKHKDFPLIHQLNLTHSSLAEPLYIPLQIDTKTNKLHVLKFSYSRPFHKRQRY